MSPRMNVYWLYWLNEFVTLCAILKAAALGPIHAVNGPKAVTVVNHTL